MVKKSLKITLRYTLPKRVNKRLKITLRYTLPRRVCKRLKITLLVVKRLMVFKVGLGERHKSL